VKNDQRGGHHVEQAETNFRMRRHSGLSHFPASSHQPPGGSVGAIVGPCIEGNRRAWGSLMNSVDDGFE
jgi:hypothetical protein